MAQADNGNTPTDRYIRIPFAGPLDQSTFPSLGPRSLLQEATNMVYRRINALGKRPGSTVGATSPVGAYQSGNRWIRGVPTVLRTTVAQLIGTATGGVSTLGSIAATGAFTALPGASALAAGATPAFYASAYEPDDSSDVLIIAYGSGPPLRWDGSSNVVTLNSGITNHFKGVCTWHDHAWFWGDPNYPTTVFGTDLGIPDSFAFSNTYGGYQEGRGDGDPLVQLVIPLGDVLYVFKNETIYNIQGYDFVQGNYQFTNLPLVTGIGTPSPKSVATLRNQFLIWWDGSTFRMMPAGESTPFDIGTPIINTIAQAALAANPAGFQAACGNFVMQGPSGPYILNDVYYCAVDVNGTGVADTILVYDDYATTRAGDGIPRWTVWTGIQVGAFVPYGGYGDQKLLYVLGGYSAAAGAGSPASNMGSFINLGGYGPADGYLTMTQVAQFAIPISVTLLLDDAGTPDQLKRLDRAFLEAQSNAAVFTVMAYASGSDYAPSTVDQQATDTTLTIGAQSSSEFDRGFDFDAAFFSTGGLTRYQAAVAQFDGEYIRGRNFTFQITESSTTSLHELVGFNYHVIQEAYDR